MVAVNYLWNPINDNIVREFDDSGNTIAEYTTEPDLYGNVVSQYRNGQTSYPHYDGQGNTTELTNDAGTVTDTIRYSAFGEVTEWTGLTEIPFQYIGQKGYYWDAETGNYSIRDRPLWPPNGRWFSQDVVDLWRSNVSKYVYAQNSPVLGIDPSGMAPLRVNDPLDPSVFACARCTGYFGQWTYDVPAPTRPLLLRVVQKIVVSQEMDYCPLQKDCTCPPKERSTCRWTMWEYLGDISVQRFRVGLISVPAADTWARRGFWAKAADAK